MRLTVVLLILSILANIVGLYFVYRYFWAKKWLGVTEQRLDEKQQALLNINQHLPLRLVFIHHSVGRNWLKEGLLRDRLMERGVSVQSATNRGCAFAEETEMHTWVPKFEKQFDDIIHFDNTAPNTFNPAVENRIIMFKPCYPNSQIVSDGADIGSAYDSTKTLSNFKATFAGLYQVFAAHPEKTFIYVTAPPLVAENTSPANAARARSFNQWVTGEFIENYRRQTGLTNLFAFDLFDVLASGENVLKSEYTQRPGDSHPNEAGSRAATAAFMTFLDRNPDILSRDTLLADVRR